MNMTLIGESGPEAVIPLNNMGSRGTTYVININNLNGFNARDIAEKLQQELLKKVSLG